jgi:hypothetical protein
MLSSKKYTLWGLKSNRKPLEVWSSKTEFVGHQIFISRVIDQKFNAELEKVYFMGSGMQPGVMRAQKREIQIG